MHLPFSAVALALGLVALVSAQDTFFEPTEFNATAALIDLGVDVTALPGLDALSTRSSTSSCSIAVSTSYLATKSLKVDLDSNNISLNCPYFSATHSKSSLAHP